MDKKSVEINPCVYPKPNIIVSCRGNDGRDNALVVAFCCNCSFDPPMAMVGIVPSRFSHKLIKESGCFVINIPGKKFQKEYEVIGKRSGRDIDKFKELNLKSKDGIKVNAPILLDCPVNIECKIVDSIMTGSHEMFVGKIEHIHADSNCLDEDGKIDYTKLDLI